jgi:hypothetical protein
MNLEVFGGIQKWKKLDGSSMLIFHPETDLPSFDINSTKIL